MLLVGCDSAVHFEKDDGGQILVQNLNDEHLARMGDNLPFGCLLSTLSDDPDRPYLFRRIEMRFPGFAGGPSVRKVFVVTDDDAPAYALSLNDGGGAIRIAQCLLPDNPGAIKRAQRQVESFGRGSWARNQKSDSGDDDSGEGEFTTTDVCSVTWATFVCRVDEHGQLTDCYMTELEFFCSGDGQDPTDMELEDIGWYDGDPYAPCGDLNPDPYCWVDGGSGSPGGDPDPDPCDGDNPPARCSNPCPIRGTLFDHIVVQEEAEQLFVKAYGPHGNPLPQKDRRENGSWIIEQPDGSLTFEPLVAETVYSCHMRGVTIPNNPNIVGILHVHPFADGDKIEESGCPRIAELANPAPYEPGPSPKDWTMVNYVGVPMYVLDATSIVRLEPNQAIADAPQYDRCGF